MIRLRSMCNQTKSLITNLFVVLQTSCLYNILINKTLENGDKHG